MVLALVLSDVGAIVCIYYICQAFGAVAVSKLQLCVTNITSDANIEQKNLSEQGLWNHI